MPAIAAGSRFPVETARCDLAAALAVRRGGPDLRVFRAVGGLEIEAAIHGPGDAECTRANARHDRGSLRTAKTLGNSDCWTQSQQRSSATMRADSAGARMVARMEIGRAH